MKKIKSLSRKKIVLVAGVAIFVLIILIAVIGLFFFKQNSGKSGKASSAAQISDLVQKVGRIIELPTNETPTVATVSDVTKLREQPFFLKAANGDKVIIYQKAKKVILYRPSANKIIEVAVYNSTAAAGTPTPVTKTVKVALYNGTTVVGLTKTIEASLVKKYPNITVVDKQNASKSDYTKTIVIDLGGNSKIAQALATELGGEVGSLPSGETLPNGAADILIILGSNK